MFHDGLFRIVKAGIKLLNISLYANPLHATAEHQYINICSPSINLFINSDAILNCDALWSIQSKKHYLQAAIVGGIHPKGKMLR